MANSLSLGREKSSVAPTVSWCWRRHSASHMPADSWLKVGRRAADIHRLDLVVTYADIHRPDSAVNSVDIHRLDSVVNYAEMRSTGIGVVSPAYNLAPLEVIPHPVVVRERSI